MKTDQLIAALAADAEPRQQPVWRTMLAALAAGGAASLAIFLIGMGVRPDIATALGTWRFDLKLALVLLALALALYDCARLANPTRHGFASWPSLAIPVLIAGAIGVELLTTPAESWSARLTGNNALVCLTAIPILSLAPLAAVLYAMRSGAPADALQAGAAAGRLAAALAAALYAIHCSDDSPLFVATWYTLATLAPIAIGAALGPKLLRW